MLIYILAYFQSIFPFSKLYAFYFQSLALIVFSCLITIHDVGMLFVGGFVPIFC